MRYFLLCAALPFLVGCDSRSVTENEPADLLLGEWTLSTYQGAMLPVQLPLADGANIIESGRLTVGTDGTWELKIHGSAVDVGGAGEWTTTLEGTYVVEGNSATLTVTSCAESGEDSSCSAEMVSAQLTAWNWTDETLDIQMRIGEETWLLGFIA